MSDKYELARKIMEFGLGTTLSEIVREGVEEIVKLADEKRGPVADAASIMWGFGYSSWWLKHATLETILGSAVEINRSKNFYLQLENPPVLKVDSFGVMMSGELHEPTGDGWSFRKKYPLREKAADAAKYLWRVTTGCLMTRQSSLRACPAEAIRAGAAMRQDDECSAVADAAWTCIDSGYWAPHHFIYNNVSAKRIIEAAEAIKEQMKPKKNTTIELTPAEVGSGLDRVKWAEGLIKQLPEDHEGRNSWLMNYGQKAGQAADTAERVAK